VGEPARRFGAGLDFGLCCDRGFNDSKNTNHPVRHEAKSGWKPTSLLPAHAPLLVVPIVG